MTTDIEILYHIAWNETVQNDQKILKFGIIPREFNAT